MQVQSSLGVYPRAAANLSGSRCAAMTRLQYVIGRGVQLLQLHVLKDLLANHYKCGMRFAESILRIEQFPRH